MIEHLKSILDVAKAILQLMPAIVAILGDLWKYLRRLPQPLKGPSLQCKLTQRILDSQYTSGRYQGQFGKSMTDSIFQPRDTVEDMDIKPRMYLTYWPVVVPRRRRHKLAAEETSQAVCAIYKTFKDGAVRVPRGESSTTPPTSSIPAIITYRHTIDGTLILLQEPDDWNLITGVVDSMLDNRWQESSGGWLSSSEGSVDLWTSVYAAKLLDCVLSDLQHFRAAKVQTTAQERLKKPWSSYANAGAATSGPTGR